MVVEKMTILLDIDGVLVTTSINALPSDIKEKWVMTKPMIGLDDECTDKAMRILKDN